MTIEEVAIKISQHMMKGVVFHTQLSEYYNFLNLNVYSQFHKYQAEEEFCQALEFQDWYVSNHGKLIPTITNPAIENIIPQEWFSHTKQDVDKATVRQGVQDGHVKWINWEAQTRRLYQDSIKELQNEVDKMYIRKLLKKVNKELMRAKEKYISLKSCDYDICQIIQENERDSE